MLKCVRQNKTNILHIVYQCYTTRATQFIIYTLDLGLRFTNKLKFHSKIIELNVFTWAQWISPNHIYRCEVLLHTESCSDSL